MAREKKIAGGSGEVDEARYERSWLFHGTNVEVADKICLQGFNRSFCGKNATYYGKGVYFAVNSKYSASKTYSIPDDEGRQYMYACKVVIGEYCKGVKDALTPDGRPGQGLQLFDSTTDNMLDPQM